MREEPAFMQSPAETAEIIPQRIRVVPTGLEFCSAAPSFGAGLFFLPSRRESTYDSNGSGYFPLAAFTGRGKSGGEPLVACPRIYAGVGALQFAPGLLSALLELDAL